MTDARFQEIKEFVGRWREQGRYKSATARNMEAACAIVQSVLEPGDDTVGYVQEHLDDLIQRYGNLNPKVGKASLLEYRRRVLRAIEDYVGHRTDPQWQPRTRPRAGAREGGPPGAKAARKVPPTAEPPPPVARAEPGNALRHRLPLRADFDVEILLPRDLSTGEAQRLTAWIAALAGAFPGERTE